LLAPLLAASLLLSGCGGSGGGGGTPTPVTLTITSAPSLDGLVFAQGTTTLASNITAGDYASGFGPQGGIRGFVSFDLSAIPAGATVLSATLTLVQRNVVGTPYATLGTIVADHVEYGGLLEAGAYARSFPTGQAFATLSSDSTLGPRTLTVTAIVQDDVASNRGHSQYRFRFGLEEDADMDSDQAQFFSAETATGPSERPTLVVTYQR
jgi:hypothetical protein